MLSLYSNITKQTDLTILYKRKEKKRKEKKRKEKKRKEKKRKTNSKTTSNRFLEVGQSGVPPAALK